MGIVKRLTSAIGGRREISAGQPERLTREHVIWGYRLFLDREPENDLVIAEKIEAVHNTRELRANFMLSPEFGEKIPISRFFTITMWS